MDRRRFLLTSLAGMLAVPLAAGAQEAGRVSTVGFLGFTTPAAAGPVTLDVLRTALRESGSIEGQNLVIESRRAEGQLDRLPPLAADLAVKVLGLAIPPSLLLRADQVIE